MLMFESVGADLSDPTMEIEAHRHIRERLGSDMAAFVIDHPSEPGRLVASVAGTVARRLPNPSNPTAMVGYVQWVCTDPAFRQRGLAKSAMESLLGWFEAKGAPVVELHATSMAEHLYESLGFGDAAGRPMRRR